MCGHANTYANNQLSARADVACRDVRICIYTNKQAEIYLYVYINCKRHMLHAEQCRLEFQMLRKWLLLCVVSIGFVLHIRGIKACSAYT